MLGKLIKYEWKSTWKMLLPFNLFIILTALLVHLAVGMYSADYGSEIWEVRFSAWLFVVIGYVVGMVVVSVVTAVYLIHRFYTTVYGDQGYLLHTLPVDKHEILVAKTLVSSLWVLMSVCIVLLTFCTFAEGEQSYLRTVGSQILWLLEKIAGGDVTNVFTVVMSIVVLFFTILEKVLEITACLSVGQLSRNHKLFTAFAVYFGIYVIRKIGSLIWLVLPEWEIVDMLGSTWEINLLTNIFYGGIFYFITWYLMKKKLNLD